MKGHKTKYNFDIVGRKQIEAGDEYPEFFLSDSKEVAEAIYVENEKKLNSLASTYSMYSGIDKSDLFTVAFLALGKATSDWDPSRSDDFGAFATYVIKAALNDYVKNNASQVSVPSYVRKASVNFYKIKDICRKYTVDPLEVILGDVMIITDISENDKMLLSRHIENLKNGADRAKVRIEAFIERVEIIPNEVELERATDTLVADSREKEMLEARLIVEQLKKYMDETELQICKGIMEEKSYEQIGQEFGKSAAWVCGRMSTLKNKLIKRITKR